MTSYNLWTVDKWTYMTLKDLWTVDIHDII